SPDGAYVAYLAPINRPESSADTLALHIYSVADGTTIQPSEGNRAYQGHRLRWTADSAAVMYHSYLYSVEERIGTLIEHRIGADGQIIAESRLPIPVFYSSANTRRWSADETALVQLSDQERYALLELRNRAGDTLVALPLDPQVVRNLGASSPVNTFQPIVYVVGGR
ncbi:MAG TPA: hypothetical protein VD886_11140, partial [Herpetosiphonaceae bacterium]|nr:hypothetical protein [Herpetosiphonaceae bacterium]